MENKRSERYKKTAVHFVRNVQRAMRVAGSMDGDYPAKMTQESLSRNAGIARSTITSHKGLSTSGERAPNPTLEKVCAIADTLNVPPAFLLMRPEDWVKLAQVIEYYSKTRVARLSSPIFQRIADCGSISPSEQAQLGLKLARMMEVINTPTDEVLGSMSSEESASLLMSVKRQKMCVFSSSSLPPIAHMNPDERVAAFVFSVIFGASYRSE